MVVKLHLICGVFLFAFLSWAHGQPVKDQELEEVLSKLQDLKRLNDGSTTKPNEEKVSAVASLEQRAGQRTVAPSVVTGYKTKRSLNNSDRRTLLYNYYSRGLAPMYDKRNFDEIDRFARFNGKRNLDYEPSYVGDHGYNGRLSKRNFDEIDRYNGFNYRLNGDEVATIGKRNFDEIDRFGRFAFNKRYFPEVNELSAAGGGNSLKHDLSDDMAVINEYSQ
ncbi:orcokinin peptides type A-like isoform X1 [Anopheles cruzii]|uniref:orcokinin peptides type A-like isoform X1 n=1 Tax=Anopheles cruzii TaxID=68878 RepID=UPI0022EC19BC|nr:orcokinin peptides type A-like isoform X1 [Anopheles cruzii]